MLYIYIYSIYLILCQEMTNWLFEFLTTLLGKKFTSITKRYINVYIQVVSDIKNHI